MSTNYETWDTAALEHWLLCHEQEMAQRQRNADHVQSILNARHRDPLTPIAPDPEDDPEDQTWNVIADLRTSDDVDYNYECSDALAPLYPEVTFDPEHSCFYAYAPTQHLARKVAADIQLWLSERA